MNTADYAYRLGIALAATEIMVAASKPTNLKRFALGQCRKAQSIRRELREIA